MLSANRIKFFRSLQQKKYRQKYGQFLVEGLKSVQEFIHQGWNPEAIIVQENKKNQVYLEGNLEVNLITEKQMAQISNFKTPAAVVGVFQVKDPIQPNFTKSIIALDSINDPGNLGTIIRIADWYGIEQVILSELTVDEFNPKVIASTMGSFARVKVHRANLELTLKPFTGTIYAAVLDSEPIYQNSKPLEPFCLLIGSESHGISSELLNALESKKVAIPRIGQAESLNAGVATGILLDRLIHE